MTYGMKESRLEDYITFLVCFCVVFVVAVCLFFFFLYPSNLSAVSSCTVLGSFQRIIILAHSSSGQGLNG